MNEESNFVSEMIKRNLSSKEKGSTFISSTAIYQPSSKNFIFSQLGNNIDNSHEQEIELDKDKNLKKLPTLKTNNNAEEVNNNEAGRVISNLIPMENLMNEINIKLYFCLFKTINKGVYYVYKGSEEEKAYEKIIELNPIREIRSELFSNKNKEYMTIKERGMLFSFLRIIN